MRFTILPFCCINFKKLVVFDKHYSKCFHISYYLSFPTEGRYFLYVEIEAWDVDESVLPIADTVGQKTE